MTEKQKRVRTGSGPWRMSSNDAADLGQQTTLVATSLVMGYFLSRQFPDMSKEVMAAASLLLYTGITSVWKLIVDTRRWE